MPFQRTFRKSLRRFEERVADTNPTTSIYAVKIHIHIIRIDHHNHHHQTFSEFYPRLSLTPPIGKPLSHHYTFKMRLYVANSSLTHSFTHSLIHLLANHSMMHTSKENVDSMAIEMSPYQTRNCVL